MVRLETQLSTWKFDSGPEDEDQTKGEHSCDEDEETPTIEADLEE